MPLNIKGKFMTMEHFYQQPQFGENWFTYPNLYSSFVNRLKNNSIIVEVGTWKGKSAAYIGVEILNSKKNITLYCVDTWLGNPLNGQVDGSETDSLYNLFLSNIQPVKDIIIPIRKTSTEAVKQFNNESIDVVFIDADHSYEAVKNDIKLWEPKVKKSGILAGHDYHHYDVKQAVNEFTKDKSLQTQEGCWIWNKS